MIIAMPRKIEISHRTVIFTVSFLILLWFLYFIREIILQIFAALLIMTILNPLVRRLTKLKLPRILAIGLVYILVIGLLAGVVAAIVPPLVEQSANFATSLPKYLAGLNLPVVLTQEVTKELASNLGRLPSQILKVGINIFSDILTVLAVFIFTFYLLLAREKLDEQLASLFGKARSKRIAKIVDKLEVRMGGWARAQLIDMFLMGLSMYLGLLFLRIPFALPLATLVGLLEIVPTLGPILAAIPAVIVGFGISPMTGLAVVALSLLLHQIEVYVFVPNVIKHSAGVSPLVTLISLVIGFKIAGVVGAILAVPVVITLQVLGGELVFMK